MTSPDLGPSFDPARIDALRSRLHRTTAGVPAEKPSKLSAWKQAAVITVGFVALLYVIEFVDALDNQALNDDGIRPRDLDGLWGILWAPLLHAGWPHLIGNTLPALVLGFLALVSGIARGFAATAIVWVVGGLGAWLTGESGTSHIGASVLIFGWLTYVLARGLFARNVTQILVGLVVLVLYGSVLWGVLPGQNGISWQGHLFGAVGGVCAAWILASGEREKRRKYAGARALPT